ncbi:MAG: hypothetical protein KKB25_01270 [Nanoarchaeota archaeon]|nr:hypothetical protein [Nanoarchaeota archaeon]
MKQLALDGKISEPPKISTLEELEKNIKENSDAEASSDMEKLKEILKKIGNGRTCLRSKYSKTAAKYNLNRKIIKTAVETGEKKIFEDYLKRIERGEENLFFQAERLADKYWLDRTRIKGAAEKYFERVLDKLEEKGYSDEEWEESWRLSDKYDFNGNEIIEALERFGEEHIWDIDLEDECFFCCRKCPYTINTENCGEKNTHQCYQHGIKHEYCLS